jgi:hypothetical protein
VAVIIDRLFQDSQLLWVCSEGHAAPPIH